MSSWLNFETSRLICETTVFCLLKSQYSTSTYGMDILKFTAFLWSVSLLFLEKHSNMVGKQSSAASLSFKFTAIGFLCQWLDAIQFFMPYKCLRAWQLMIIILIYSLTVFLNIWSRRLLKWNKVYYSQTSHFVVWQMVCFFLRNHIHQLTRHNNIESIVLGCIIIIRFRSCLI